MTQQQKGFVGLGVMAVMAGATIFGSTPLYKMIDSIAAKSISYQPGTYTGSAQGYGGEVSAVVIISEAGIDSVELKGNDETEELGGEALVKLPARFVEAQGFQVDAVSGCTITSTAAMEAVRKALQEAR
ncbi:MAG: FMN-binding protein [Hungatella sp.]